MSALVDRDEIARLSRMGVPTKRIAERLECTERTVNRARVALGIATGSNPQPVTDERLAQAERMLAEGMSLTEVGRELHLGNSSLWRYLRGRGWTKTQAARYGQMVRTLNSIEPIGSNRKAAA